MSTPEPLRLGPAEYLLRALSGSANNLDLFWQSVVERMKRYGFYFLDPRMISIEFRGGGKLAGRRFAVGDRIKGGGPLSQPSRSGRRRFEAKSRIPLAEQSLPSSTAHRT